MADSIDSRHPKLAHHGRFDNDSPVGHMSYVSSDLFVRRPGNNRLIAREWNQTQEQTIYAPGYPPLTAIAKGKDVFIALWGSGNGYALSWTPQAGLQPLLYWGSDDTRAGGGPSGRQLLTRGRREDTLHGGCPARSTSRDAGPRRPVDALAETVGGIHSGPVVVEVRIQCPQRTALGFAQPRLVCMAVGLVEQIVSFGRIAIPDGVPHLLVPITMLQRAIERGPRAVDVVADVFPGAAIDAVVVDEGDVERMRRKRKGVTPANPPLRQSTEPILCALPASARNLRPRNTASNVHVRHHDVDPDESVVSFPTVDLMACMSSSSIAWGPDVRCPDACGVRRARRVSTGGRGSARC